MPIHAVQPPGVSGSTFRTVDLLGSRPIRRVGQSWLTAVALEFTNCFERCAVIIALGSQATGLPFIVPCRLQEFLVLHPGGSGFETQLEVDAIHGIVLFVAGLHPSKPHVAHLGN